MSKLRYTLIAALAAPLFALPHAAMAAEATGQASAVVVTPISVSETASLSFGNIAPSATAGEVTVSTAGARSVTGGVSELGGTVAAGAFTVDGSGSATYGITLPANGVVTLTGPGTAMAVKDFGHSLSGTPTLSGGTGSFTVGATLEVGASQAEGTYNGTYTVSVNYN